MITRMYVLTCDAELEGETTCGTRYKIAPAYVNDLWRAARGDGWTRTNTQHFCSSHPNGETALTRERETKTVVARRRQDCSRCHDVISPGDHIKSGPRVTGWVHEGCYPR